MVTILFLTTVQIFSCGTPNAAFPCSTTGANTITRKDVSVRESYDFSGAYIFNAGGQHELRGGYQRFTIFNDVQSGNSTVGRISLQLRNFHHHSDRWKCNLDARSGRIWFFPTYRNQWHGIQSKPGHLHPGQVSADLVGLTLNLGIRFEKENLPSFNSVSQRDKFWLGRQNCSATWICLRPYRRRQDETFRQLRQVLRPREICASARFVRRRHFSRRLF